MRNRIRELREQARLTQAEVAKLLDMNETDVCRLESGARPLTPRTIARLAHVFKVDSWQLFFDRKGLRSVGRTNEQVDEKGAEAGAA